MDIMEEINRKRRGEDITKESVSEIISKAVAPDYSALARDYAPVIDQILIDFSVSSEYAVYEEDGHPYMCIPTSSVKLDNVEGYTYDTIGGFTVIQLDAMSKESGCASASGGGYSNARYSDKPKKSKTSKGIGDKVDMTVEELRATGEKLGYMGNHYGWSYVFYLMPDGRILQEQYQSNDYQFFDGIYDVTGDGYIGIINDEGRYEGYLEYPTARAMEYIRERMNAQKSKKTKIDPCIMSNGEEEVKVTTSEQYDELLDKGYTWLYDCTPDGHGTWTDEEHCGKSKTKKSKMKKAMGQDILNIVPDNYNGRDYRSSIRGSYIVGYDVVEEVGYWIGMDWQFWRESTTSNALIFTAEGPYSGKTHFVEIQGLNDRECCAGIWGESYTNHNLSFFKAIYTAERNETLFAFHSIEPESITHHIVAGNPPRPPRPEPTRTEVDVRSVLPDQFELDVGPYTVPLYFDNEWRDVEYDTPRDSGSISSKARLTWIDENGDECYYSAYHFGIEATDRKDGTWKCRFTGIVSSDSGNPGSSSNLS